MIHRIVITPSSDSNKAPRHNSRGALYDVTYGGRIIVTDSTEPCLAACRALKAMGITGRLEMWDMLAAQMVALHNAAMECFRRAMIKDQTHEGRQQNLSFAYKLTRSYALAMEALDKHRGKGQQKVTVEHVHVHQGGQAIVGNVQTGAGVQPKKEEQPDAKTITDAPEPEMRSAFEKVRETMLQRRDEER